MKVDHKSFRVKRSARSHEGSVLCANASLKLSPIAALLALWALSAVPATAAEIDTGVPELKVRWDNTIKYSTAQRLQDPSAALITPDANTDDGDRNFARGMISNRIDLLSEVDVTYRDMGFRVSAAGWYDDVYNHSNNHNSPLTASHTSAAYNQFTNATRDLMGNHTEILDAFVFGKFDLRGSDVSLRLGRQSLLYGESLFFGANGIAVAQAPIDIIKALAVPNTQFKELARPVNQISGQIALSPNLTIGGYYQLEWAPDRLPPVGSYFSFSDVVDVGGERIIAASVPGVGPVASFYRAPDPKAPDSGQGGVQIRYRSDSLGTDFGLYAAQYHEKLPFVYVYPGRGVSPGSPADKIGEYALVYPENIQLVGSSFSTTIGDANVGGEISFRQNMPLANTGSAVLPGMTANANNNPLYAVGNSAHAQFSMINVLSANALWPTASLVAEIAWNRLLSISKNPAALDPNATRDASAVRFILEPSYYQVLPGLDITVPLGVGYGLNGNSAVVQGFGVKDGGDMSLGLTGEYLKVWKFTANYTHYFGTPGSLNEPVPGPLSYKQTLADRDFLSLSISRTF